MAHSLLLFGAKGKADHVVHRQQGCQAAPSDRAENTPSQQWGEGNRQETLAAEWYSALLFL